MLVVSGTPLSGRSSLRCAEVGGRAIFFGGSPGDGKRTNDMRTLHLHRSASGLRVQWSAEDQPTSGPRPAGLRPANHNPCHVSAFLVTTHLHVY